MTDPSIQRFMTASPHTIGQDQTLAAAHRMMQEHSIRHLPVLDGGKLVGILSLRDLHFIETLTDTDQNRVQVSEAMSQNVFAIGPRSSVRKVAAEMAEQKYGSAIVIDKGQVVGIFTTVDALKALSSLLDEQRQAHGAQRPASDAPP
ncbi:MAG TPA: CBS domain-containing protein [Polyangiaceae bacterium]|nr:CBS domain-containing protein [Polyangiaceae bacterium]